MEYPLFIIISTSKFLEKLVAVNGGEKKGYHIYPWIMSSGVALNGRGLLKKDRLALASVTFPLGARDLTKYHDN